MAKKRRRRGNTSRTERNKQRPEMKTPETLIKEGNFKEAVRILGTQVAIHPTDAKRRMLGDCFFRLANYQQAADILCAVAEKTDYDFMLIGYAFLCAEDWELARHYLNEALRLQEHPLTLYFLARAHLQDHYYFDLDEVTVSRVLTYLQKARSLHGCPAGVFLLLDSIVRFALRKIRRDGDISEELERTNILQEAFALHPDDEDIRIRYASLLFHPGNNYEAVLMVLAPLVSKDNPPKEALEYAIAASVESKLFEKALQYIEKVQDEDEGQRPGLTKLKGDFLVSLGRFDEAILCYQRDIKREDFVAKFIGIFSHAWALILNRRPDLATGLAREGAHLWFERAEMFEGYGAFYSEPLCIGTTHIGDDSPALYVKNVCERLLQNANLDESLRGQLCYLFYQYYESYYDLRSRLEWEQREEHATFLLLAERLFPHPIMYPSLVSFYRYKGNFPYVVKYHLEYTIRLYGHDPGEFEERFAELDCEEEEEKLAALTKDERLRIHEVAFARLQVCKDTPTIRAVFTPFFSSFWHDILLGGEMYEAIADTTAIFIRECADDETHLWNYAYSVWQLGKRDEAERIFRQYLENHPDDSSTLLNLSVLLEEKGQIQEAAALISRAITLDPTDERIIRQHSDLQEEMKRLEEQERVKQKQEMFLRSAPERWRQVDDVGKKLLYVMTTAKRWDGFAQLANKAGIEETRFQVHWKNLVELGMVFAAKESLYQINPYILHFVRDEGLLLSHPALTSILKDIADIETAETLLKETLAHLQSTVLGLAEQVGDDSELRDKLIWHLYWKVERVQQTWLKKAFGLKDKELREITTKAWVEMICPACKAPHMVNMTSRSEFKRIQDTSWQQHYAKCPSCKETEQKKREEEAQAYRDASEKRKKELHTMPYKDYLQTPEWQERRKRSMRKAGYSCQMCNAHGVRLNVHHRTYERRGYEDDGDLITLCAPCHTIFYEKGKLASN